jgi:hypothetical protein
LLALLALAPVRATAHAPLGSLQGPVRVADGRVRSDRQPYVPRAGDLVLYTDDNGVVWRVAFALARTGPPYHCGIVVDMPDGRPGVLEAGAYDLSTISIIPLDVRFRNHAGPTWVRRLRQPLTREQSARLTAFAVAQTAKKYALARICLGVTPFRAHGRIHAQLFGSSCIERSRWFCSELTVAAAAVAGVLDPHVIKPNTVYPRDMYLDKPYDFSPWWEGPALWVNEP